MIPQRVVSLTCSNTEIVAALGCAGRLVGVDDHSDYPGDVVAELPRVGPDLGIDVDRVSALEPDLVLASLTVPGHEEVVAAIEARGLPYLAPAPESLADIYRDIETLGEALGAGDRASELVADLREELLPVAAPAGRPRIGVQWWPKPPILPGRRSWVRDLIQLAGGTNLLDEAVKSRPVPPEELASLDPDALVLSWCGVEPQKVRTDVIYQHPAYAESRFVTQEHVHRIPEAWLGRPGPRVVEGYRALRRVVEAATNRG